MMLRVYALEPLACHVRVNLRGGNVCMSQQQLHDAQVSAMIDQVGGERVT